jgi:hypothetical protein
VVVRIYFTHAVAPYRVSAPALALLAAHIYALTSSSELLYPTSLFSAGHGLYTGAPALHQMAPPVELIAGLLATLNPTDIAHLATFRKGNAWKDLSNEDKTFVLSHWGELKAEVTATMDEIDLLLLIGIKRTYALILTDRLRAVADSV